MKKILIAACCFFTAIITSAQNFTGGFSFAFPYKDSLKSPFLPGFSTTPLDTASKVTVAANNFIVNKQPYKFWGVNIVANGAFPEKADAGGIAAHAAKMGINLVRFHHLDNPWGGNDGSIFAGGQSTRSLNTVTLDKLDYFIYQLKQHGIYTNMNLNVSRSFNNLDGVPGADSLREFGKGVTIFDPQLVALQKEYASRLLGHINPYTGLKLSADPALAMVEMINENSLYGMWKDGVLVPQSQSGWLTWRHSHMLDSMWNRFLQTKYATQNALQAAWITDATAATERIADGGFEGGTINPNWQYELHETAAATFAQDGTVSHSGAKSAKINITTVTGTDWHIQFKHVGFSFQKDTGYKIKFWAKSSSARTVPVSFMRNGAPYTWYGGTSAALTPAWQEFSITVIPPEDVMNDGRLSFNLGANTGTVWIDDVSVKEAQRISLNPGEDLNSLNIQRNLYSQVGDFAKQRMKDLSTFYITLQKNFLEDMRSYLRNTLGVTAPVTGNNAFTGIQEGLENENLDYYDDHAYWDHPNFPGIAWDANNWFISNTPMVKQNGFGAIPGVFSGIALNNKPMTVSEYNHAAPNRYRVEMVPAIAAYGSFQGMDGLMFFDYNSGNAGSWSPDMCDNFFSIHRDHSVMSLFPAAAFAYRNNFIKEGTPFLINYSTDDVYNSFEKDNTGRWGKYTPYDKTIQLSQVLKTGTYHDPAGYTAQTLPPPQNTNYTTSTSETRLNTALGLLTTVTPKYVSIAGYLNAAANTIAGPVTLLSANDFGVITWLSINNKDLDSGDTSFIAISAKQQNTGMSWANNNTTINNNWGSSPTSQLPLNLTLRFTIPGSCMLVHTLNTQGKRVATKTVFANIPNTFDVIFDQSTEQSLWYAMEVLPSNTIEWTGAVSKDWFNAGNWCCGQIPGPASKVIINSGKVNYPLVTASVTIWSLRVNEGAVFNAAPGVTVFAQGK
ncbi:MAG: carbohydrate binding domain-containing protein [Ferruginibacter sp.]